MAQTQSEQTQEQQAAQASGVRPLPKKPVIAIIDDFSVKVQDIDGDGKPDLAHGEVIERILKSGGLDTLRFPQTEARATTEKLAAQLSAVNEQVKKNPGSIQAVNLSWGQEFRLAYARKFLDIPDLTRENVGKYRQLLFTAMSNDPASSDNDPDLGRFSELVHELKARGVKVYVAAGNESPVSINRLGLPPDVVVVGATFADKTPTYMAGTTGVDRPAQGVFGVRKTKKGYDIDGNGTTDVTFSEVTNGESRTAPEISFSGRPVKEVRKDLSRIDLQKLSALRKSFNGSNGYVPELRVMDVGDRMIVAAATMLPEGLYSVSALASAAKLKSDEQSYLTEQFGDYVYLKPSLAKDYAPTHSATFFRAQADGTLLYDPERSSKPGQIQRASGTSYATPKAIVEDYGSKRFN